MAFITVSFPVVGVITIIRMFLCTFPLIFGRHSHPS
jgi:hypothetical protein